MTRASAQNRTASVHRLAIEVARGRLSTVVDSVQDQPMLLTRRGRPVAAVITMEQYEMLMSAQSGADRRRAHDLALPAVAPPADGAGEPG